MGIFKNYVCIFLSVSFIVCSCNNNNKHNKSIFRYNETSGIASLDPAFAKNQSIMWAIHQLYNTLVEVDDSLKIKPSIAKYWTFSEDRKTIVFTINSNLYFHDDACFQNSIGRKLVAADVVYSFKRIIDKTTASPGAWIFNDRVDSISPFFAANDTTVIIKLQNPFNPILGILSMQYCSIVPKEAVEKYGNEFRRHPVGTGPFSIIAWDEGQTLLLKRNTKYFEKDNKGKSLPYLDGIKVSFYDSKATEFLQFQQGNIDFINDIDPSFKDEVLTKTGRLKKEWHNNILLQLHPYLNIEYLGILVDTTNPLVKNSPLKEKKIRQAINYGIDKKKMMLYLRNSIGTAAESGFVPQGLPSFNADKVKGYSYNPEKAKQLLEEAGFKNGRNLPTIKLLTIPIYANLASYISNELLKLGIAVQVETIQKSLLLQQTSKQTAPFFRASWIADYPDAENYLSVFYGKNPTPPNYTRYNNKTFNALYEEALSQTNDSIRYNIYQAMDRIIIDDAPIVPLWYDKAIHLVNKNIKNFIPNSLNMLELRRVQK